MATSINIPPETAECLDANYKETFDTMIRGFFSASLPDNSLRNGISNLKTELQRMARNGETETIMCRLRDLNEIIKLSSEALKDLLTELGLTTSELVDIQLPESLQSLRDEDSTKIRFLVSQIVLAVEEALVE